MTYGWAILIIAIVMIALFQLGIFNQQDPRITAGACEVYHGNNVGECQGVWPQFVAQFNGQNADITISNTPEVSTNSFTWSIWISPNSWPSDNNGVFGESSINTGAPYMIEQGSPSSPILQFSNTGGGVSSVYAPILINTWQNVVGTYNYATGVIAIYVNGKLVQSATSSPLIRYSVPIYVGDFSSAYFNGRISNVQIYNTSLSQSEITTLYQEGIGGAPIAPNYLVGWWPLNGNAQDYSGNNNQGTAVSVAYNSSWTSGYVQP